MFYKYDRENTLCVPEPYRRDLTPICMAENAECRACGVSVHMCEWPGRGQSDLHIHEEKTELMYVVDGQGYARCGEETREIGPGSLIIALPGVVHQIKNTNESCLRVLCIFSAPQYEQEMKQRAMAAFEMGGQM